METTRSKNGKRGREGGRRSRSAKPATAKSRGRGKAGKRTGLSLMASADAPTRKSRREMKRAVEQMQGLYRPLKSPVTMRLDADVLLWFKKDGRRYQTRINKALRKVMESEMKGRARGGGKG
jgi:uncharacterized protein (DUF4415 family)